MKIIEQQPTFLGEPWTPGLPTTFLSGVFCTPGGMAWPWLGGRPWARYCCCRARNSCSSSATTCTTHHRQVCGVMLSAVNRFIGEVVQSRRRPLLGPSPG